MIPQLSIPDPIDLRLAPEMGIIALLLSALGTARSSLQAEHPRLNEIEPIFAQKGPTASELLAGLVLHHAEQLSYLLLCYKAAVDDAIGAVDDLPF
jgi:hypothetical protein